MVVHTLIRAAVLAAFFVSGAQADETSTAEPAVRSAGVWSMTSENDLFGGTDRNYSNGLRVERVRPANEITPGLKWVADRIPVLDLMADADSLSVAAGGTVNFSLFPPPEVDVDIYQLLGSTSGTAPGLLVDGLNLPLNVDSYTLYTLANPFTLPLSGGLGSLDANGTASATFTLPAAFDPVLVGLTVDHAYATFSFLSGTVTHTSNAVGITFTP